MRLIALLVMVLAFAACGDQRPPPGPDGKPDERAGQLVLDELEPRIMAWRSLAPEQRDREAVGFGSELESALARTEGTSAENKVLLWLADWRLRYGGGTGVREALDRLEASKFPKVKAFGERLRVEWLLRSGDVRQARTRATRLVERIPEFEPLLNLVSLHERIGQPPPRTAGTNASGGPDDPATRTEPWVLYLFIPTLDTESRWQLTRWLREAGSTGYANSVRLVLVTSDGTPLSALTKTRDLPYAQLLDVLWASPAAAGDGEQWRTAWNLASGQGAAVLLGPGPKRLIVAAPSDPEELRAVQKR